MNGEKQQNIVKRTESPDPQVAYDKGILQTSKQRDARTVTLLTPLITIKPFDFVVEACREAGIEPPKPGEQMAPKVLELQKLMHKKDPTKFMRKDILEGQDGKLGDYTLEELINNFSNLKQFAKSNLIHKTSIQARQNLRQHLPLKPSVATPEPRVSTVIPPTTGTLPAKREVLPVNPKSILSIGDSISVGAFGASETVKGSMGVGWMLTKVKELKRSGKLKDYAGFTICGGANNVGSGMEADEIFNYIKQICEIILSENPNAIIALISLPPIAGWRAFKNKQKIINKVIAFNDLLKNYAKNSNNISFIDIYRDLDDPKHPGYSKLKGDGLHPYAYYKTIKQKANEALAQGAQDNLSSNA